MGISSALGSSALLPAGLGFRNVLINGDFKVWQRGTSKAMAVGAGTGFIADRWTAARAGYAAGGTVSRQTASLDGFQYCSRVQRNSGNTSTAVNYYFQTLESVTSIPLANKPVVYSFYIRAGANFSGSVTAKLYSGTATDQVNYPDGGITGSATVITSTLSLTTSWQRVVLYGNVGTSATQLFAGFEWTPSGTAGAADYYEITGVQLEQNYQPTPFEQRPIGVELALCQRYYYRTGGTVAGDITIIGYQPASTSIYATFFHLVEMRTTPSLAQKVGTWSVLNTSTQPVINAASKNSYSIYSTVNPGITNANQSGAQTANSGTYLEFSAEL
tara:strand:- start:359 stop:1348 length:990 start_codon:yes stop_codon:yes gene_type:complete